MFSWFKKVSLKILLFIFWPKRDYANSLQGVEPIIFKAYAETLEIIPFTLAESEPNKCCYQIKEQT